jgi:hypothetical protein
VLDEEGFTAFMKKEKKSNNTIKFCHAAVEEFEKYFERKGKSLDKVSVQDLEVFISDYHEPKKIAKFLWGLRHYFFFVKRDDLLQLARSVIAQEVKKKRKPFKLKKFRGILQEHSDALASEGVVDVDQMLEVGKTPELRIVLAEKTGLDIKVIEELVKLSDLARIPGLKGIRARLYYDAGFDQLEKLRESTPEEVLRITQDLVQRTGFDGIAPLPKEALGAITTAKKLPDIVEW